MTAHRSVLSLIVATFGLLDRFVVSAGIGVRF